MVRAACYFVAIPSCLFLRLRLLLWPLLRRLCAFCMSLHRKSLDCKFLNRMCSRQIASNPTWPWSECLLDFSVFKVFIRHAIEIMSRGIKNLLTL